MRRRGFTAIECLVVLAMLAVVVAIVVPHIMAAREANAQNQQDAQVVEQPSVAVKATRIDEFSAMGSQIEIHQVEIEDEKYLFFYNRHNGSPAMSVVPVRAPSH